MLLPPNDFFDHDYSTSNNETSPPIDSSSHYHHHHHKRQYHQHQQQHVSPMVHTKRRWYKKQRNTRHYRNKNKTITPPNPVMITVINEEEGGDLFSVPNINPVGVSSFTTLDNDDNNYEDIIEQDDSNNSLHHQHYCYTPSITTTSPSPIHSSTTTTSTSSLSKLFPTPTTPQLLSSSPPVSITNNNNKRINSQHHHHYQQPSNSTSPMSSSPLLHYMIQNQIQKKMNDSSNTSSNTLPLQNHQNCTILSSSPKNNVNIMRNKKKQHNFHKKKYEKKAKRYYREQRSKRKSNHHQLIIASSDNEATNEIIFDASKSSVEEDSYFKPSNRFKNRNNSKNSNNNSNNSHYNSNSNNNSVNNNSIFDEPTTPSKRFVVQDDDFFSIPKQEVPTYQRKRSYSNYSNSSNEDGLKPSQYIEFKRMSEPKPPQNIHFNTPIKEHDDNDFNFQQQQQQQQRNVKDLSNRYNNDDIFNTASYQSSYKNSYEVLNHCGEEHVTPSTMSSEGLQSDDLFDIPSSNTRDDNLQSDNIFDVSSDVNSSKSCLQSDDLFDIPSSKNPSNDDDGDDDIFNIPNNSNNNNNSRIESNDSLFDIPNDDGEDGDDIFSIPTQSNIKIIHKSTTTSTALQDDDIFNIPTTTSPPKSTNTTKSTTKNTNNDDLFSIPIVSGKSPSKTTSEKKKKNRKKHMVGNLVLEKHTEAKTQVPTEEKQEKPKAIPNYTESGSYLISDRFKCNENGAVQILDNISPGISSNNLNLYNTNHFLSNSRNLNVNSLNRSLSGQSINHLISIISHAPKSKKRVTKFNKTINWNDLLIMEELGSGFSSSVIKCSNNRTGQLYALKQIKLDKNDDKNSTKMIEAEFNCLVECKICPYICSIVDSYHFIEDKTLYILLEFMDKGTIKDCVKEGDKIPENILSLAACQLLMGLQFAHNKNILHRDIKPENILLNSDGFVKLADWGMASILKNKTHANTFQGTASYMSPERLICSDNSHSFPCDVYSLGLSLVELALGYFPMPEQYWDLNELYNNDGVEFWLDRVIPFGQFSNEFTEFTKACLEKEPSHRMKPTELLMTRFITIYNGSDRHNYGGTTHRRIISDYLNR